MCGGATLLVVLGVSTVLSFIGNVTILISLLSTLRETGVRRRVYHRMEADPEAELEEIVEDGELIYPIEELRLDVVRVLLDGRTLLFYAAAYLHMASFSEALWGAFAECLGGVGLPDPYLVRGGGWWHAAGGAEAEAAGDAGGVVVVGGGIGGVGDAAAVTSTPSRGCGGCTSPQRSSASTPSSRTSSPSPPRGAPSGRGAT